MTSKYIKKNSLLPYIILLGLFFYGCNNSYIDEIIRGEGYEYRPGFPELRMAANGLIDVDNNPIVEISGDIVLGSLVYTSKNGVFEANLRIDISITNTASDTIIYRDDFSKKIEGDSRSIITDQRVFNFNRQLNATHGEFIVNVSAIKQTSHSKQE